MVCLVTDNFTNGSQVLLFTISKDHNPELQFLRYVCIRRLKLVGSNLPLG